MPLPKKHKKDFISKQKDQIGDTIHHGKPLSSKEKYKGKNHWLALEDDYDDLDLPHYKDEEE